MLAVSLALIISAFVALCLPVWASISLTLAVVLIVAAGGGALLAKVSGVCALVLVVAWLWRRQARRKPVQWHTVTAATTKDPQAAHDLRTKRRAA